MNDQVNSKFQMYKLLGGRSNVFVLFGKNATALIDTGPSRKVRHLDRMLKKRGIENIEYIILTHSHFDHCGNAAG
ncbi:MAG: MBL fold metallo-hydrolase [Bacteroidales bacterium]|nr:MBL fold metallo-hydrolase [Bacteroidales bacterium]